MGLSNSPRIFTKIMKPIFAHLRGVCMGILLLGYIDDSIYLEDTKHLAETATFHARVGCLTS